MADTRITALTVYADSTAAPPRPSNIAPDVELYQKVVGGYLEAVYGETREGERVVFYVNEDGIAQNLDINEVATRLWRRLNPAAHQALLGNVVVVGADGCDDADLPAGVANLARVVHHELEIEGYVAQLRAEDTPR